jgi:ribose 1,5-bisphosphokinase PhnN
MKTNMIFAVYYIAKTLDGRGALSNNDTRQVLSALGGNWTSSDAAIAAIKAADQILVDRLNARREKFEQYQRGLQQPRGAPQAPAPSAGSQPGAQQQSGQPQLKTINSRAEYDALEPGSRYIDGRDGIVKEKGGAR